MRQETGSQVYDLCSFRRLALFLVKSENKTSLSKNLVQMGVDIYIFLYKD